MRSTLLVLAFLLFAAGCVEKPEPEGVEGDPNAPGMDDDMDIVITPVELAIALVERPGVGVPPTTMALDPARLEVKEDQRVRLTITNGGQAPHDLVIEGLDVDTDTLSPGGELVVEFIAQERGEFVMYCSVGGDAPTGHRAQGMEGTFVVA